MENLSLYLNRRVFVMRKSKSKELSHLRKMAITFPGVSIHSSVRRAAPCENVSSSICGQ